MFELLKKIGLTSAVAGLVAALVTIVPIIFKVDDRYAKDDDLALLTKQINELSTQVSELAGTQKVLVTIIASTANKVDRVHKVAETIKPLTTPVILAPVAPIVAAPANKPLPSPPQIAAPALPPSPALRNEQLKEVLNILDNAQRRSKEIQHLKK